MIKLPPSGLCISAVINFPLLVLLNSTKESIPKACKIVFKTISELIPRLNRISFQLFVGAYVCHEEQTDVICERKCMNVLSTYNVIASYVTVQDKYLVK